MFFSFFALLQFLFEYFCFFILFVSCNESRMKFSVDKGRSFSIKDEQEFNM